MTVILAVFIGLVIGSMAGVFVGCVLASGCGRRDGSSDG